MAGDVTSISGAYTAFWNASSGDHLIREAEGQFESWLRGKGRWDPPTESSGISTGPAGQELLALHHRASEGRSMRLRLIEPTARGTWRTTLTVHESSSNSSWLSLQVMNSDGVPAKVPRLASYLLDAIELMDGDTWLSALPRRVRAGGAEQVAEEVTDLHRQGLYLVAGTDDSMSFESFASQVDRWTKDVRGMAQVVVLDPTATREFSEIVGDSHAVSPWTIRTFDVDTDPAIASDGRRHRILGTRRLAGSDRAVSQILSGAARRHATRRPFPQRFGAVDAALGRLADQLLIERLFEVRDEVAERAAEVSAVIAASATANVEAEVPSNPADEAPSLVTPADEAAAYLAQVELVKEILGIDVISASSLANVVRVRDSQPSTETVDRITRELEERRARITEVEFERDYLRLLSEDQELELAESLSEQARSADEVRWLRRRLAEQGGADAGYSLLPDEEVTTFPNDFTELADMIDSLQEQGVVFTGDKKDVISLADHDHVGRLASVTWQCLLALCDYVRSRHSGHDHGVRQYLEHTPHGFRRVPPKKFAAKESSTTMKAWGNQRQFRVPVEVDPAGSAVMEAHFKLGLVGSVSPRMYYLDNYADDGKIYVGYIGAHLRNTKTN